MMRTPLNSTHSAFRIPRNQDPADPWAHPTEAKPIAKPRASAGKAVLNGRHLVRVTLLGWFKGKPIENHSVSRVPHFDTNPKEELE